MGVAKRAIEEKEANYSIALKILQEIGAVEVCPIHGDEHFYNTDRLDHNAIYGRATNIFKEKYLNSFPNITLFHEQIKAVLDGCSDEKECPWCRKMLEE
ncbi:MAG: hypothetical protein IJX96_03280 [Clostridia bacterium]|nr:hypothetical protein [Clostridia bacterium]